MIYALVKSAFETGCFSVASESLIRQILAYRTFQPSEIEAIAQLEAALNAGQIRRESYTTGFRPLLAAVH